MRGLTSHRSRKIALENWSNQRSDQFLFITVIEKLLIARFWVTICKKNKEFLLSASLSPLTSRQFTGKQE
jgi:hypothetical protein